MIRYLTRGRGIPAGCVARRLPINNMRAPRALPAGRRAPRFRQRIMVPVRQAASYCGSPRRRATNDRSRRSSCVPRRGEIYHSRLRLRARGQFACPCVDARPSQPPRDAYRKTPRPDSKALAAATAGQVIKAATDVFWDKRVADRAPPVKLCRDGGNRPSR